MAESGIDLSILEDFKEGSLDLISECIVLLETIQDNALEVEKLNDFASRIDRVMVGAKSLALMAPKDHALNLVADYCAICKSVGQQGSQVFNNDQLCSVVVALLLDAVEMIQDLFTKMDLTAEELKKSLTSTFLDRLKWISSQYDELKKNRNNGKKLAQNEIDEVLRKLGL